MNWSGYRIDPDRYPLDFAKCGTPGNYRAHLRRGEKPCGPCLGAEARRSRDRKTPRPSGYARKKMREAKLRGEAA